MSGEEQDDDFAALLAANEATQGPRRVPRAGERVEGRVVAVGAERAFLDIGAPSEAEISLEELRDAESGEITVKEGDTLEVTVTDDGRQGGALVCRRVAGRSGGSAEELSDAFANGIPVEGLVTATNKGGFEIQIGTLRGFCPASQMDLRRTDAAAHIGQRYLFKITKLEQGGRNVVVARRPLLEAEARAQLAAAMERVVPGATVRGTVSSLRDFGAFVDLGGVEGMVHVSELGHARDVKPEDVLAIGQEVEAQVLRVDKDPKSGRPRVALSMRALAPDPWADVAARFPIGATLHGKVRKVEQFGAFVTIAPGLDGLVHVSRMALGRRINHPRNVVSEGQEVEVTVVSCDPAQRRIGLSMVEEAKRSEAAAAEEARRETESVMARQRERASFGTLADLLAAKREKRS